MGSKVGYSLKTVSSVADVHDQKREPASGVMNELQVVAVLRAV
jgi:hypothetical protein